MSSYQEPSELLKRLFLPPKNPSLALSSDDQWLLFLGEPPLPGIELLSKQEEKLAGSLRFDPELLVPSRLDYAFDLHIQELKTGFRQKIPLPSNSQGVRYVRFNPNPPPSVLQQFVFTSKVREENRFELYICDLTRSENGQARWTDPKLLQSLAGRRLNCIRGCAYRFTCDGKHLLVRVEPAGWPSDPPKEPVSVGPAIQVVTKGARKAPGRTYQDLLKNKFDETKLRHFMTTELVQVDLTGTRESKVVPQSVGGKMIFSMESSPCGRFLLVALTKELSYSVPLQRFGKDIEVWDLRSSNQTIVVVSNPVDDEIPISYDACSRHPRGFTFHPCFPHSLLYSKALDGGDPEQAPADNGERDAIYSRELILGDGQNDSDVTLSDPVKLVGLEWRFSDIEFLKSGVALVDEYRWKDRMLRKWKLSGEEKTLIWERSWEDRYASPGEPLTRLGENGQYFVVETDNGEIFLKGAGASPLGDRPFLDSRSLETGETKRLWRCKAPKHQDGDEELNDPSLEVGNRIPSEAERDDIFENIVTLMEDNDTLLISRESKQTPRNYFVSSLSTDASEAKRVTDFPHPQPDLLGIKKELVKYQRNDGVNLTANLYFPANYDQSPRPTLFWAYPREFKDSKAAGQVQGSKHRFVSASWASPVHWAAKGWVVMDGFSLPVVGEGDVQPNDTFVDQIVAGATAAVEYAAKRGVCDRDRCAVGGHSYGSFMTAHLLSHTSLFAAGIGRSGAFNRTLTPMSFQSEDRSLWEAPDTYINMSPLMHVKKFSEQERVGKLLLIHGEVDENSGTYPMQSERYFAALKAFGIESRLCILPHERHTYEARESILHMAWEQEEWLRGLEEGSSIPS